MWQTAIPQHARRAPEMPAEMADEPPDVRRPDILARVEHQVERDATALGRYDQGRNTRELFMPASPQAELGRAAALGPRPANQRGHEKPRLVDANQPGSELRQFF